MCVSCVYVVLLVCCVSLFVSLCYELMWFDVSVCDLMFVICFDLRTCVLM